MGHDVVQFVFDHMLMVVVGLFAIIGSLVSYLIANMLDGKNIDLES